MRSPALTFGKLVRIAAVLGAFVLIVYAASVWERWNTKAHLDPSGGRYFFQRVEILVPLFRQNDPRWGDEQLAETPGTIGSEGCAISSAAMVLAAYGIDTDPPRLNRFLVEHDGYTPQGWIYWEKAAELAPDRVRHVYEDLPTYWEIDRNLSRGNPVIVRLRLPSRTTHFVVLAGKEGFDYLVRDPGAGAAKGLYPLREFGSRIEGLRYYERVR